MLPLTHRVPRWRNGEREIQPYLRSGDLGSSPGYVYKIFVFFYTFTKQEVPRWWSCFLSVLGTWVCFLPWAVSGNNCLVKGSILSHIHFEWLSGRMDGCEWVHSLPAIHSPRQSFPLTHSFQITVCANWLLWIKSFTSIHTDSYSHSSIHHTFIPTKPAVAGFEHMSPEQIGNSSITCATETPARNWWEVIIDFTIHETSVQNSQYVWSECCWWDLNPGLQCLRTSPLSNVKTLHLTTDRLAIPWSKSYLTSYIHMTLIPI